APVQSPGSGEVARGASGRADPRTDPLSGRATDHRHAGCRHGDLWLRSASSPLVRPSRTTGSVGTAAVAVHGRPEAAHGVRRRCPGTRAPRETRGLRHQNRATKAQVEAGVCTWTPFTDRSFCNTVPEIP